MEELCQLVQFHILDCQMLIRESISGYKHFDLGNIKIAFTQVCQEETFKKVFFAANSLYYVESGNAILSFSDSIVKVKTGEVVLIKQHSKLDIQKSRDKNGTDFKSIIFYLFPDFVSDFIKQTKEIKSQADIIPADIIHLGKDILFRDFFESLLPLFEKKRLNRADIQERTFSVLTRLSQGNKELLYFLAANSKPVKIDLYEFMIHIVEHNYSVGELARLTGRSLSSFKRDFYNIFETTPHQWLLQKKVDIAEQLISTKKMKASDIYFLLGFNELSHFSAAFKKLKGIAPSQL